MLMTIATHFALAFVVPPPPSLSLHRSAPITMVAPGAGDLKLQEAAARGKAAAAAFGDVQQEAASKWVDQAMMPTPGTDAMKLLETQHSLFEECVIDDEDGWDNCKELDAALTDLEGHLMQASRTTPAEAFFAVFGDSKMERAASRVRVAAGKFGPEQSKAASEWIAEVKKTNGGDPTTLLESQELIFGECLLDEDGCSLRCFELQESLNALQECLGIRGSIVSTCMEEPEE